MSPWRSPNFVISFILIIFISLACLHGAHAVRSTPELFNDESDVSNRLPADCFDDSSFHLSYPTDLFDKARSTMVSWDGKVTCRAKS
ncbi:hypothetical protein IHE45_10G058600 [Dioscorea alata]|uniref:Uncharacterized protein n=1 Tax=Dioscorea alata TaxID=55571 RepID=A0ACB7VAV8_DIOAL|nr:hypothetical protein IHE45_10G058600 [Dioscorea alata]